ncbi:MAG: S9 family peptidase [Flavobacteriaceae bacterium]|nr:MAG: S9 family peptidase [Flavobacteriaceae bacterium]
MKKIMILCVSFILFQSVAQQKELTLEDSVLGYYKGLYPKSLSSLQWVKNTETYLQKTEEAYTITNAQTQQLVNTISLNELQQVFPQLTRLPYLKGITATQLRFTLNGGIVSYNYQSKKQGTSIFYADKAENIVLNDAASHIAYTLENNLYIATSSDKKIAVTTINDKNIVSGQTIHRSEFGISGGIFWSPKGNYLAFYQKDETNVSNYPLVDVTTYPATLKNVKYPMAGQGSEQAKIGIYNVATGNVSYLDIDTTDEHYLTNLTWSPDEKQLFLAEINRGQNHVWFNSYDVASGNKIKTLFEETEDTWAEPEHPATFLPNSTSDFLWFSERDGFMNLYHYTTDETLVKQLTNFNWVVQDILGFDAKGKHVIITGTGTDGREKHTFKINLKSGKSTQLTTVAGTHRTQLSSNGAYLIDSYSNISTPKISQIIRVKKGTKTELFKAENPLKGYKLGSSEFIDLKTKKGITLHARITKPANFDPSKKYPVLIYVYGGPHAQMVTNTWMAGASLWMPIFTANQDYIVFTLDNRGSKNRGFAFENVIHRNVGVHEIEDQLTGVDYLKSLPYVDANRIAVNGWSYGGFMSTSLMLRHPGVFTTAVAGGPVIDWKYYEVMYGERYMDTPQENPEGYKKAHVTNYIKNLEGKMLIIHGSVDPVVVPQHSMSLLQKSVKEGIQVDFFTYPMHEHNVRGRDRVHLMNKMLDYVVLNNK